jgi:hypothetical protein
VPLLEQGEWPAGSGWMPNLRQLAGQTEVALKAYCATESHKPAA